MWLYLEKIPNIFVYNKVLCYNQAKYISFCCDIS